MSASTGAIESRFIQQLLEEVNLREKCTLEHPNPVLIYGDSTTALTWLSNPILTETNKHIQVKVHHVRELVQEGYIEFRKVHTSDNIADIFTKALPKDQHFKLARMLMGMNNNI
eukprot:scaffold3935_cov248-Prasinococcus_capsulatus_cf.AAC.1